MKLRIPLTILSVFLSAVGLSHGVVIWSQGADDGTQDGNGDATLNDTSFYNGATLPGSGVQELGPTNTLPGDPANTGGAGAGRSVDDDFYFEGLYSTVVDGGAYIPVGAVITRETYWERALTNTDSDLRFHFNVPAGLALGAPGFTTYEFNIDFYNLSETAVIPGSGYDLTLWVDGTQVGGTQTHDLTTTATPQTWQFPTSALGGAAEQGAGFDHYVEIRSTGLGNSRWASLDYAELQLIPEPSSGLLLLLGALLPLLFFRRRRQA